MKPNFLSDFHMHSAFSFDGRVPLNEICEQAIAVGLDEIAITDHADLYAGKPLSYRLDADTLYPQLAAVKEQYKDQLTVRIGVELGQPQRNPKEAARLLSDYPLDFVIGSIHNMEQDYDIYFYDYTRIDCYEMYGRYLNWMQELAEGYDFDVLGHVTYPLRYMADVGIRLDLTRYEAQFRTLFTTVIKRQKGIELNLSGLYQTIGETMPSLPLLQLYKDCGGTIITLGSDAHYVERIGANVQTGIELLKKAGFSSYCTFENRTPVFHPIAD
ncbi:MAG: histidinol-phosphatase HisJ family protein [Lachnospiraceae bacterium]